MDCDKFIDIKHDFDYLLVLDFEAQCREGEHLNVQEIIEFPVIVVNLKSNSVFANYFHTYVKPTEHTKLYDFCTQLTGIKQEQIDTGMILNDALEGLDKFIKQSNIHESKFCFVTCGDWDLLTCLRKEAQFKKISYNDYLKKWINLKTVFYEFIGEKKRIDMLEMLKELGLPLNGRHHSGIDDARNIAEIVMELIRKGQNFCLRHVNNQLVKKK